MIIFNLFFQRNHEGRSKHPPEFAQRRQQRRFIINFAKEQEETRFTKSPDRTAQGSKQTQRQNPKSKFNPPTLPAEYGERQDTTGF